ncbi:hypothetical protein NAT65_16170 [Achromobacter xylosoxidans]|uniref:hypothetical protein n=1 Tax=Alcaligenes xylosoxydans xylosoxydans TaxID=85698 RepID=UPI00203AD8FA|nr:hypothetical protein [Achromobacter xylosoxidans]MCM2572620.1 hypothetical protein [Achromobacter xylosoxidans]
MPDHIPYPTSCKDAQGRVWHAYSVKFYSPDGSYECHISAISDDHARLQLDALKETGHLTGQTLETHAGKEM